MGTLNVEGTFTLKVSLKTEKIKQLAKSLNELADNPDMLSKTFAFPQGGSKVLELVFEKTD